MRAWLVLLPVALVTLVGLPLQWVSVALRLPTRRTIPVLYHRVLLALIGVRVRVIGGPAATRPLLIVANHVSWLDIPVLGSRLPLCFVAKSEVGSWPGIGLLARLQRTIFVDRSARGATGKVASEMASRMSDGDAVVLFAEGTSSDGNRVLPFRSALVGAARGAMEASIPATIQPLAIAYVGQGGIALGRLRRPMVAWYGDMDLAPHLLHLLRRGAIDVELRFGAPVEAQDRKSATQAAESATRALLSAAITGRA